MLICRIDGNEGFFFKTDDEKKEVLIQKLKKQNITPPTEDRKKLHDIQQKARDELSRLHTKDISEEDATGYFYYEYLEDYRKDTPIILRNFQKYLAQIASDSDVKIALDTGCKLCRDEDDYFASAYTEDPDGRYIPHNLYVTEETFKGAGYPEASVFASQFKANLPGMLTQFNNLINLWHDLDKCRLHLISKLQSPDMTYAAIKNLGHEYTYDIAVTNWILLIDHCHGQIQEYIRVLKKLR